MEWTDQPPAPDAVMELVSGGCEGQCQTQRCSCGKTRLPCSDTCICGDHYLNRLHETSTEDNEVDTMTRMMIVTSFLTATDLVLHGKVSETALPVFLVLICCSPHVR